MLIDIAHLLPAGKSPPKNLLTWLTHQASLTDKLRDMSGQAQLDVLKQYWTLPNSWNKQVLGISEDSVFQRDILMLSQQKPCWYARSIIPKQTYQANSPVFNRLTQESMGAIVFTESSITRLQLVHYPVTSQCMEFHWLPGSLVMSGKEEIWARLSVYNTMKKFNFYLIEILLPGLTKVIE